MTTTLFWALNCLTSFVICIFLTGIVIPKILLIAFRKKLFDVPDERKIHTKAVPRLGGIAFHPVIFFTFALIMGINILCGQTQFQVALRDNVLALAFGYCAIMILYLIGIADDLVGIRYRAKFVVQILCGILLVTGGIWIDDFHGVFGIGGIPTWVGYPLTVLVTVFLINAINLIDGVDGLASGLSSIALLCYGIYFFMFGQYIYALISFGVLGVLVQFFYYNVFGNPDKHKKIFMGDTGSLTVGMILSILAVKMAQFTPNAAIAAPNTMILAISPILIPCFDVIRVYFYRIRHGQNPFLPDKNHIHHKLLAVGMGQRTTMITIVASSAAFVLVNILLERYVNINLIIIFDIAVWTIVNILLRHRINEIEKIKQLKQA